MSQSQILVVGSLAFDVIFSIPHDFRQAIPLDEGQIRSFNATYVANDKNEYPGGTAGNIAAWLGTQKIGCSVFSAWGKDLETKGYHSRLVTAGVDLRGSEGAHTAHCYSVSDPLHQQLVIWQPNHYEVNRDLDLSAFYTLAEIQAFEYVIFSAGTPPSILRHMQQFRALNERATVVFDPGQVTPIFTPELFAACVELADVVIGNDIEADYFKQYLPEAWPKHVTLVITLGERGVKWQQAGEWQELAAQPVEKVVETTGAGDAFRAGLLAGLVQNKSLESALKLGTELGAACVQLPAGQPE